MLEADVPDQLADDRRGPLRPRFPAHVGVLPGVLRSGLRRRLSRREPVFPHARKGSTLEHTNGTVTAQSPHRMPLISPRRPPVDMHPPRPSRSPSRPTAPKPIDALPIGMEQRPWPATQPRFAHRVPTSTPSST